MRDENTKISALPIPRATEKPQTFEFFRKLLETLQQRAQLAVESRLRVFYPRTL